MLLHKLRYLEFGDEYDRVAYLGLSGQIGKDVIIKKIQQENGRRQGSKMDMSYVRSYINWDVVSKSFSERLPELNKKRSKYWVVTSPVGEISTIKNMASFCRNNNLDKPTMTKVAKGQRKQHKGWRCKYANT